jgi:hypothetical protein
MVTGEALSRAEIEAFAATWYRKLDIHAPAEELVSLVAEQGLEMQFPEGSISGVDAFRRWYEGVIGIFFDEVHTITRVSPSWQTDRAQVEVVVNWQSGRWRLPAARSEWIGRCLPAVEMIRPPARPGTAIRGQGIEIDGGLEAAVAADGAITNPTAQRREVWQTRSTPIWP